MKKTISSIIKGVGAVLVLIGSLFIPLSDVLADGYGITVAPMNQKVVLNPGESFESSFKISNPITQTEDTYYELSIEPFYTANDGDITFEAVGDSDRIVDWITIEGPTEGVLSPNEVREVKFKIDTPKDASAGGQYASIIATAMSKTEKERGETGSTEGDNMAATIKEIKRVAHLVYAEVTGNTIKKGEIMEANVPGFLFSGNIAASSSVKNEGNVHGTASYTLQVFPLFSGEEVYTNEEEPETHTVLPDRTYYNELTWNETPAIGIFKVIYKVEFEGSEAKVEKMVIKCPIWLLFVIIFAIVAIIVFFVVKAKTRKKA